MAESLRAAVVGLGIGRHHAEAYAAHPRVELAAVCDASADRLATAEARYPQTRRYATLEEMLANERLDLVSICTPDWMHVEMGTAALRAGAHVVSTKPLATTVEDAQRFIAAADAAGRYLMVAHERRFWPRYRAMKRIIDEGLLGKLFYVEVDYFTHKERQFTATPWYQSAEHPRAPILGTGCHAVDLMRWFGGEVEEAWGAANHLAWPEFPDDDCQLGIFRLSGGGGAPGQGTIGKVIQTYASIRGAGEPDLRVTIHGDRGSLEDERFVSLDHHPDLRATDIAGRRPWQPLPLEAQALSSHHVQINHFVDSLLRGERPYPDGREGARTVAAALAVVESARTGRPVRPAQF